MHFGYFGSVDRFEPAKRLICLQIYGIMKIRRRWNNESKKGGDIMKKEILNGTRIPYELSVEELSKMLSSPIMKDFSLA